MDEWMSGSERWLNAHFGRGRDDLLALLGGYLRRRHSETREGDEVVQQVMQHTGQPGHAPQRFGARLVVQVTEDEQHLDEVRNEPKVVQLRPVRWEDSTRSCA